MIDQAVTIHAQALQLTQVSCNFLKTRDEELAHHLGYTPNGVRKGSSAARSMSLEAKRHGRGVPSIREGGFIASLQSIGSKGSTHPSAHRVITRHLRQNGLLPENEGRDNSDHPSTPVHHVDLPTYFSTSGLPPQLSETYRPEGYNCRMAARMMNDSILTFCRHNGRGCESLREDTTFRVIGFSRIENREAFERYKRYESRVGEEMQRDGITAAAGNIPGWLKRLSLKNGLSSSANATYLLHGTPASNLAAIVKDGLKTSFSLLSSPVYGRGLYFTDSSCKANTHARNGFILLCRVVLGRTEVLPAKDPNRLFPSHGFHSAMAKRDVTASPNPVFPHQLHNEYIVFNESACYPEFVLKYELS